MDFKDVVIRPGYFVQQHDEGGLAVKAQVPGIFNNIDKQDKWPWIEPWYNTSVSGMYSKLKTREEIWVMMNKKNKEEIFWMRKLPKVVDKRIGDAIYDMECETCEVLCSREMKNGEISNLFLTDTDGWMLNKGNSEIQIRKNGNIKVSKGVPFRTIDINDLGISLGSEGKSLHPAVYGDVLIKLLLSLTTLLKRVEIACLMNPHTVAIGNVISSSLPPIIKKIPTIASTNVTLD